MARMEEPGNLEEDRICAAGKALRILLYHRRDGSSRTKCPPGNTGAADEERLPLCGRMSGYGRDEPASRETV